MDIHNGLDTIDSRDIISRYNEIVGIPEFLDEATLLEKLIRQGETSSEWDDGIPMIHEDFFVEYTKDLIDDCWDIARDINKFSSEWPYRHLKIDYVAAAEELMQDYTNIDFDGVTYYIRA